MKYAIIGGGIAGLYAANQLIVKYNIHPTNITIYEKTNRWGGRIQTQTQQSFVFHCGAGRFKKTHIHLMNLIKRYGFENKIYSFDNRKEVRFLTPDNINIVKNKEIHQIISKVLTHRHIQKHSTEHLHTINTFDYFSSLTDNTTANVIKTAFGYDAEFDIQNADATLSALQNDFNINSQYYSIQGYLEQIIDAMVDELLSMGVSMILNCTVKEIVRTQQRKMKYNIYVSIKNDDSVSLSVVDTVILALDRNALLRVNIPLLHPMRNILSKSITSVPLCRIYAAFPNTDTTGKVWFSNIRGTVVSNTRIRQFIPYDITTGFCVISYTDGETASNWNRIRTKNELVTTLLHELKLLFPDIDETIPEPSFIKKCFWQHGCHVWNVGYPMNNIYSQILHPVQNENIYICGEAYSLQQGWIEGALLSVHDMFDIMKH